MTVTIKSPEEIEKMRVAGRLAAEVLEMIGAHVRPGVTTEELDRICHDHIVRVQGSHALLDGHYLNGGTVSKVFLKKNRDSWRGGEELLDDLLRALPSAWVMNRR